MKKVTRKITVDMSRRSYARVVFATQNDLNSRCLSIALTDDGKAYNVPKTLTATVNFKRSDGVSGAYLATVCDDGTLEYLISPTVLAVAGQTECTVSLFDEQSNKLTSAPFVLDVAETLYLDDELSEDARLDYLDEMIAKFTVFQNDENARKEAEILRDESEFDRGTSEGERRNAEKAREAAELVREQNESDRKATENARFSSELRRAKQMEDYAAAEDYRANAEQDRYWNEDHRINAELSRQASENARQIAEQGRKDAYADIDKALDAVLNIQNALIGGDGV